jgi:hypothetical protein
MQGGSGAGQGEGAGRRRLLALFGGGGARRPGEPGGGDVRGGARDRIREEATHGRIRQRPLRAVLGRW